MLLIPLGWWWNLQCSNQSWQYFQLLKVGHVGQLPSTRAYEDEAESRAALGSHQSVGVYSTLEASYVYGRNEHECHSLLHSFSVRRGSGRNSMLFSVVELLCLAVRALSRDPAYLSLGLWVLTIFLYQRGTTLYHGLTVHGHWEDGCTFSGLVVKQFRWCPRYPHSIFHLNLGRNLHQWYPEH